VALLKERDGQTFDGEVHLSSAEAAAITAQIERLTRERDEALEQIGAINERALDDVSNLTMRAEAAEAEVKRLRTALVDAVAWINESYRAWAPEGIGEPSAEPYSDGEPSRMGALMSALSGGASNG
jgi:tRNA C32,U32 (ribose-2'-O)-methylase TrmJ